MNSELVLLFVFTLVLSLIFKHVFWLKIPLGLFLLNYGAIVNENHQVKGLVLYLIAFSLPYLLGKKIIPSFVNRLIKKRLSTPVNINHLNNSVKKVSVVDDSYFVNAHIIDIREINCTLKFSQKLDLIIDISFDYFQARGFFILPIMFGLFVLSFFFGLNEFGLNEYSPFDSPRTITDYFKVCFILIFGCLLLSLLESFFFISPSILRKEFLRCEHQLCEERRKELQISAEKEQSELIEREERERAELRDKERLKKEQELNFKFKREQEKIRQTQIEADLKKEQLKKERPQKEKALSKILDKLDEL
ncbi:MAG: hypothetical protein RPR97_07320 [Colwellia sp.]